MNNDWMKQFSAAFPGLEAPELLSSELSCAPLPPLMTVRDGGGLELPIFFSETLAGPLSMRIAECLKRIRAGAALEGAERLQLEALREDPLVLCLSRLLRESFHGGLDRRGLVLLEVVRQTRAWLQGEGVPGVAQPPSLKGGLQLVQDLPLVERGRALHQVYWSVSARLSAAWMSSGEEAGHGLLTLLQKSRLAWVTEPSLERAEEGLLIAAGMEGLELREETIRELYQAVSDLIEWALAGGEDANARAIRDLAGERPLSALSLDPAVSSLALCAPKSVWKSLPRGDKSSLRETLMRGIGQASLRGLQLRLSSALRNGLAVSVLLSRLVSVRSSRSQWTTLRSDQPLLSRPWEFFWPGEQRQLSRWTLRLERSGSLSPREEAEFSASFRKLRSTCEGLGGIADLKQGGLLLTREGDAQQLLALAREELAPWLSLLQPLELREEQLRGSWDGQQAHMEWMSPSRSSATQRWERAPTGSSSQAWQDPFESQSSDPLDLPVFTSEVPLTEGRSKGQEAPVASQDAGSLQKKLESFSFDSLGQPPAQASQETPGIGLKLEDLPALSPTDAAESGQWDDRTFDLETSDGRIGLHDLSPAPVPSGEDTFDWLSEETQEPKADGQSLPDLSFLLSGYALFRSEGRVIIGRPHGGQLVDATEYLLPEGAGIERVYEEFIATKAASDFVPDTTQRAVLPSAEPESLDLDLLQVLYLKQGSP